MNVFLLLGTVLGVAGLLLASVISVATGSKLRSALFGGLAAAWVMAYGAALVLTGLWSREVVLPSGETKYFCGFYLDCHIGVAVLGDSTATTIGDRPAREGRYHIVTLRFSSSAVRATLRPYLPNFDLVGPDGRYPRDVAAERMLFGDGLETHDIPPGGSYTTTAVFDVPASWTAPRLYARQGLGRLGRIVEGLLIGDEDAFGHRKVMLALPAHSVRQEVSVR